jgi:hypothetical protein
MRVPEVVVVGVGEEVVGVLPDPTTSNQLIFHPSAEID